MVTSIGIDPGVKNLGLAAITNEATTVQKMSFPAEGRSDTVVSDYIRCTALCDGLYAWLLENIPPYLSRVRIDGIPLNVPVVAVEGPSLARGGTRTVQVGFLHMAIYTALVRLRNVRIITCPPMVLKKWVTGSGNANKERVMEGIIRKWFKNDIPSFGSQDLYEAYAFARLGELVVLGEPPAWMLGKVQVYTVLEGSIHEHQHEQ